MKTKVGLFFGGKSVEHEVSIISALQAAAAFDREKYDILPIYMTKTGDFYIGSRIGDIKAYRDIPGLLKESQQVILLPKNGQVQLMRYPMRKFGGNLLDIIDIAFPIVHGTNVEDGALQGYFQTLGIPYVGCDVLSSAIGMDKYVMKAVLRDNGIPVLPCLRTGRKGYYANPDLFISSVEEKIGFPVIAKPIDLGSSIGIKKAKNREELADAVDYAFQFANLILVERAIESLKEINCSVLGDAESARASECEEPVGSDEILSYEDKYLSGGKSGGSKGMQSVQRKLPAEISPEMREQIRSLAVKAFQALGCNGVSRIDFMLDQDSGQIYFNEINTIPGSLSFYLWEPLGVPYSQLLDEMIRCALKRERENKDISYSFDTNILAGAQIGGSKGKLGGKL